MKKAEVYMYDQFAGILTEDAFGYKYQYDQDYLNTPEAEAISLTLPLSDEPYLSNVLFPFFDGLIPEGWLLNIAQKNWKFDARDRMEILLKTCKDCIGAVSIKEIESHEE